MRSRGPAPILFGGRLPQGWWGAARELALLGLLLVVAQAVPPLAGASPEAALANARALVELERELGLFSELAVQGAALAHPALLDAAHVLYVAAHVPVTAGVLVWLYAWRPATYARVRGTFVLALVLMVAGYLLLPTAPPRYLLQEGFLNTATGFDESATQATFPYNRFAAMPSGHVAFALLAAAAAVRGAARRRAAVALWAGYPVIVTLVVVATAHHLWIDVLAGAAVALLAWAYPTLRAVATSSATKGSSSATARRVGALASRAEAMSSSPAGQPMARSGSS